MRILVTGAAGLIGSHLAERLASRGHSVVGVDCLTGYYDRSLKQSNFDRLSDKGVETRCIDLAEGDLRPALRGVKAVYHLAAQPGLSPKTLQSAFVRNNVRATEHLLPAASGHPRLEAFFFASTSSVYGAGATGQEGAPLSPTSTYGRTKLQAERTVRAFARGEPWHACILRLFSVYGPRERPDKLIHKALRCARTARPSPCTKGAKITRGASRTSATLCEDWSPRFATSTAAGERPLTSGGRRRPRRSGSWSWLRMRSARRSAYGASRPEKEISAGRGPKSKGPAGFSTFLRRPPWRKGSPRRRPGSPKRT